MNEDDGGGASRSTDPAAGSSAATDVSLREFLERRINDLSVFANYRDTIERRFRIEMIGAVAMFGTFAWAQVQRRLEILNHENERLLEQQRNTVSHDTYSANEQQRKEEQTEFKKWKEDVDRDRTQSISREEFMRSSRTENRAIKQDDRQKISTTTAVIGAAIAVIVILLQLANYVAVHNKPDIVPVVTTTTTQ